MSDRKIVSAAIFPPIGIARVGNSEEEYFIGPEVLAPQNLPASFYKDRSGALKRQAARFRIYGLDAAGRAVRELTADDAEITWRVHVANKKAAWYEFDQALDISTTPPAPRRNANFSGDDRQGLAIDPGPRSISGKKKSGRKHRFDSGEFLGEKVYLGELRTDQAGRLLFLGGHGLSQTPFPDNPPTTFANNNGWHDDSSDGPVDAEVTYKGRKLAVEGAWVVTAPPNYAPDIISVLTIWDVMDDTFQGAFYPQKPKPSFQHDILPLLRQFSEAQWVNFGFYVAYGYNQPYDFEDHRLIARLADPAPQFREYRRQLFNAFRPPQPRTIDPEAWPWMYGDQVTIPAQSPEAFLSVTPTLFRYLGQWVAGDYIDDWDPDFAPPAELGEIADPQEQADTLTKAALWYCLGGPFHPGCEVTWPVRHTSLYSAPFRIRRRSPNNPEPDYGDQLTYDTVMSSDGPLYYQAPGDITRWMAVPWQTDTASCRAGYDKRYDPWVPTFWPARVPNHVLTEESYRKVVDPALPREQRLEAFNHRASWYRILGAGYLHQVANMIDLFGDLGVVGPQPGVPDDPDFPPTMYVESVPGAPGSEEGRRKRRGPVAAQEIEIRGRTVAEVPDDQGLFVGGAVDKVQRRRGS